MRLPRIFALTIPLLALTLAAAAPSTSFAQTTFTWATVVNNADKVPKDKLKRNFNSYNQPSINMNRLVVFRARSKGGSGGGSVGEPAHGVFTRDMSKKKASIVTIFDRSTQVPQPNNLGSMFVEPPSFPRIDMSSATVASRGNHQPVWEYLLGDGTETRAGTTGIYTDPFRRLITGASNLGAVPDFSFFAVPGTSPAIKFDVFPGAPAVTDRSTIVFKGNYSVPDPSNTAETISRTGVFYRNLVNAPIPLSSGRRLAPAGGTNPVVVIADTDSDIPNSSPVTKFGSTAPPSAAGREAVFAGFDNEDNPTMGGIYMAPLTGPYPSLTPLVRIGDQVPGEAPGVTFNKMGEGLSFDGRFVGFWGAWGTDTRTLILQCASEGNAQRRQYCLDHANYFPVEVPVHQGIFVYDTVSGSTYAVAQTSSTGYTDFVYWNFSGLVPGTGESDETGEPARWRSAEFVAVSGLSNGTFRAAFKARTADYDGGNETYTNVVDGIYLGTGTGATTPVIATVVQTGMDGTTIDPQAVDTATTPPTPLPVTEMGVERDGFRGDWLTINVSMGTEEAGWAGIYLTNVNGD